MLIISAVTLETLENWINGFVEKILLFFNHKCLVCWLLMSFTNQGGHFLDFYGFSESYTGPKSNLYPRTEISSIGSLTPTSPLSCYCFKYYWLILKKKTLTLTETYYILMELAWLGSNHLKVFLKNGCSG